MVINSEETINKTLKILLLVINSEETISKTLQILLLEKLPETEEIEETSRIKEKKLTRKTKRIKSNFRNFFKQPKIFINRKIMKNALKN